MGVVIFRSFSVHSNSKTFRVTKNISNQRAPLGLQNRLGDPSQPITCSSFRLSHVIALQALRQFHVGNSYSITMWKLASSGLHFSRSKATLCLTL